uniref:Testis expressed 15, meiosis and synapsis associated n=1 Tax=Pelusios castaneus TaxID=367368 RepID=A0A8C8S7W0_9SAUR
MEEQLRKFSSFPFEDTKPEIDLQRSLSMKDKADHCDIEKGSSLHKNNIKHVPAHDSKKPLSFSKKSRHSNPLSDQKCQSVSERESVLSVPPPNFACNTLPESMPQSTADSSSCLYSRSQKCTNPHMPSVGGSIFSSFSEDSQKKNSKIVPAEDLKKKERRSYSSLSHVWSRGKMSVAQNKNNADEKSKVSNQVCKDIYPLRKHDKEQVSAQRNHSKWDKYALVKGGQKFPESQSINLTALEDNQRHTPEQSLNGDEGMNICIQHPESVESHEGKTEYTRKMHNQLQENNSTSEIGNNSIDSYLICAEDKTLTSPRKYKVNSEGFDTQDHTLDNGIHGKMHLSKHAMRKQYTKVEEDKCVCQHFVCESVPSDKIIGEENVHESKLSEKANVDEGPIKAHKVIYSATKNTNKKCIGKREEDATKEAKGNSSIKETVNDQIHLSHGICKTEVVLGDYFNKECLCFLGENESGSLDKHFCRDSKEGNVFKAAFADKEQSWFCNQEVGKDINVQDFNQMHTCQPEKEFSNVPGVWMEVCDIPHILDLKKSASGLNLIFEEGCALTEAYLIETENIATFIKEKEIIPDNKRESEELSATAVFCRSAALPETHKWEDQNAVILITTISIPSGNVEHKEKGCSQTQEIHDSEENSFYCENNMQKIFKQIIEEKCEDIFIEDLELASEIEIPSEKHEESLSTLQNLHSHEGGSNEDVDSLYQFLKDRIDWASLFGNTSRKISEKSEDYCSLGKKSCTKEYKTESLSTTVWPDLQITITNILKSGFSTHNIGMTREMWRYAIEPPGSEVNTELSRKQRSEEYVQELDLTDKTETCLLTCVQGSDSHMPEKESSTFTAPAAAPAVTKKGSNFSCSKPKDNSNDFKSNKSVQSKVSKRERPHNTSLTNHMRPKKALTCSTIHRNSKLYGKKRKHCSSEMFSLLFEGRIKTLAQSEKHIKNVLNALYSEASLCKSKRLSKKIDGAMFHLRKAQRRVHKSLKIVTKVGEKRQKGPLPKCYEIIRNDLWESCDLEGHSFMTIGKYSSAHFSRKRKCNIKENKQTIELKEASATVTCMPIKQSFKMKGGKMREMVLEEEMATRFTTGCAPVVLNDILSQIHHCKSDLMKKPQLTCNHFSAVSDNVRDTRRIMELQTVSENSVCLDTIGLEDMELTNKEHKVYVNVSSKIHIQEMAREYDSVVQDTQQNQISEANTFTNTNTSKFLSLPVKRDTDTKKDGACHPNVNMNAVIQTSLLKTAAENCLNADTNKQDVSMLLATPKNLEGILSTEKEPADGSGDISTNPNIGIGNFSGSMRLMPAARGKHDIKVSQVQLDHKIISANAASLKMSSSILSERILDTHFFEIPEYKCKGINVKIKHREVGTELKSLAFITEISKILQKADETLSLEILQEQITACGNLLPSFIEAFEENQGCSFKHILVSRELLVERKLWTNCKSILKSCAVDSFVELQMIMETIQFIENKKCFLEKEPTFRSLLWYDDSLYTELLGGQSGYQQQSNFYPAFQRRLKYNVFHELQSYHGQLLELFEKTRWEKKSYYAFLKCRREIDECEAVMQHNSDCFDFFLSVPFTCGVNFGDTLEDLETVRKSAVELINTYSNFPDAHSYAEKEDHLWVIMEIISTKISFIKACESINMKASLFGLEHIFFDAAKSLVWKDTCLLLNKASPNKRKQLLCKMNKDAVPRLYEVYEYVAEEFRTEKSNNILEKKTDREKSKYCENKETPGEENPDFLNALISHPDICCIGEILEEAQFADLKKLQQLMLRCTEHLEMLKTYFQILQEEDVDKILITERNVLDTMKNDSINTVILKPEAVETYIEVLMMYETVHFLKNSIARKVEEQRFRSLLWFDLSLLPELVHSQEKMSSFSFLKDNSVENLCKTVESAISELKNELNVICNYAETINCAYALHLLTRELTELSETRKLIQNSKTIFKYVECVPYTISVNYGSTVTELDYNYNQFSLLLENLMLAARKDLGKMAHIMKIMKTIEHMKFACAEKGKSVLSLLIYQMLNNWRKTCQLKRKGNMKTHKKSVCETKAPVYVIKGSFQPQKKRPNCVASHGNTPECTESSIPSSCKKQKVRSFLNTSKSMEDQSPSSSIHSKDLESFYCSPHVKSTPDASESSFINLKSLSSHQNSGNLEHMIKRNSNCNKSARKHGEGFASCDKTCENAPLSLEKEPLLQQPLENASCLTQKSFSSTAKLGASSSATSAALNLQHVQQSNATGNISRSSLLPVHSTTNNLAIKPDREEKKHEENSERPTSMPVSTSDPPNSELQPLPAEHSSLFQNELPASAPPVQGSFVQTYETYYPYYSLYSCHQSDSNGSSITQTYQGITYEVQQHAHFGTSAVASTVYNACSSTFYSQSFSSATVGELQRPNYSQTYPMYGYFSSQMPLPYGSQVPSLPQYPTSQPWSQGPFPYSSNAGSYSEAVWNCHILMLPWKTNTFSI